MKVDSPIELVQRAGTLVERECYGDAETLLAEAWRLAQETSDHWTRGDIAFRIAATYRAGGRMTAARRFDAEAARCQQRAFGIS